MTAACKALSWLSVLWLRMMTSSVVPGSSRGDHRTKLRQDMLVRLFDDHVMELLLTMAQHANQVQDTVSKILHVVMSAACQV